MRSTPGIRTSDLWPVSSAANLFSAQGAQRQLRYSAAATDKASAPGGRIQPSCSLHGDVSPNPGWGKGTLVGWKISSPYRLTYA
jgi:hypothetical protein